MIEALFHSDGGTVITSCTWTNRSRRLPAPIYRGTLCHQMCQDYFKEKASTMLNAAESSRPIERTTFPRRRSAAMKHCTRVVSRGYRQAFTLVELLVVITIIAILVALLSAGLAR